MHPRQALAPEEVEKRLIPAVRAAASAVESICECDVMVQAGLTGRSLACERVTTSGRGEAPRGAESPSELGFHYVCACIVVSVRQRGVCCMLQVG